jgi:hypothetical protein
MASAKINHRVWKVPRNDGEFLIFPSIEECSNALKVTRHLLAGCSVWLGEKSLSQLAEEARYQLWEAACRWTRRYGDWPKNSFDPERPIVLTGHQPELFHPGVWLKYFVAGEIARSGGAVVVNLLIDNDVLKSVSVPVLSGDSDSPILIQIPFDRGPIGIPFELREICDPLLFESFATRAMEALRPWVRDPLLDRYWALVKEGLQRENRLGYILAEARNRLEQSWNLQVLDVPMTCVSDLPGHLWFVAFLMLEHQHLWAAYNASLQEFRETYRVRNRAQPVPDLSKHGDWWEFPYWVWTKENPRRRRLFVSREGDRLYLRDEEGWEVEVSLGKRPGLGKLVEFLTALRSRGIRIRPRALTTTLFARLALGDLFVHGVGAARYDEVTNRLVMRLFQVTPPPMAVVTGTLWLAEPRASDGVKQLRELKQTLRDVKYHPEKFFVSAVAKFQRVCHESPAGDHDVARFVELKRHWITTPKTPENARVRHLAIDECNNRLREHLNDLEQNLLAQLNHLQRVLKQDNILRFREFPFCFYSGEKLRRFLAQATCQIGTLGVS